MSFKRKRVLASWWGALFIFANIWTLLAAVTFPQALELDEDGDVAQLESVFKVSKSHFSPVALISSQPELPKPVFKPIQTLSLGEFQTVSAPVKYCRPLRAPPSLFV